MGAITIFPFLLYSSFCELTCILTGENDVYLYVFTHVNVIMGYPVGSKLSVS